MTTSLTRAEFERSGSWGLATSIDLHGCDGDTIRDPARIHAFVIELCRRIDVRRFGDCQLVRFGEHDPRVVGLSMTQLVETSLISGHFAEATNAAYLDVFSCKYYAPAAAVDYAVEFFKASDHTAHVLLRR
jgi:S-adenosylmethionine/arginine decarboxylase-like enzyme